ncbi:copper transporter [Wolfiporia cocos MD-104 SS10]|uniref:Copper transport protein n=1 Tax=Wolfiporia cocos (strain MD-104) TaxID=742152 RepID=A0A2H3JKT2_WOLCO|nr:copper transporter [Wolfiporia cocos MD-104 SS10]
MPAMSVRALITFYAVYTSVVRAASNGMDMSTDDAMPLAQGEMLSYLHFTPGDILWFQGWVPKSSGAMVGTCIGLLLLGMLERWITAASAVMQMHWSRRAYIIQTGNSSESTLSVASSHSETKRPAAVARPASLLGRLTQQSFPPFILSHDIPRGILYMAHAALSFAFMLAAMTFQLAFILSLIVGLGVGETLFGRFVSHAAHLH